MGKADAAVRDFFSDPDHFADLFNMGVFKKPLVRADGLRILSGDLITPIFRDADSRVRKELERILDDLRLASITMEDDAATYVMLGAEYQMLPHPAMPVRALLDAGQLYARQVQELGRENRKKGLLKESGAFLSGLLPEDRLHPVIIVVLYLGDEPWDAPTSIGELLTTREEELLRYAVDCRLNLVRPEDIENRAEYRDSQFWKAMRALAAGHISRKAFLDLTQERAFEVMRNDTVRMLNTLLGTNIALNDEGGHINMCKAMREINEEIAGYKKQASVYKKQAEQAEVYKKQAEQAEVYKKQAEKQAEQAETYKKQAEQAEAYRKQAEQAEVYKKQAEQAEAYKKQAEKQAEQAEEAYKKQLEQMKRELAEMRAKLDAQPESVSRSDAGARV